MKYWIFFLALPFLFSGCFWNWDYNSAEYKSQLQEIYTEVVGIGESLSEKVATSSLASQSELQNPETKLLLDRLAEQKKRIESLAAFRGTDSYKTHMIFWIDSQIQFFEKDMVTFLSAPEQATSSDDIQGSMQALYEATKKIKEAKVQVETDISEL